MTTPTMPSSPAGDHPSDNPQHAQHPSPQTRRATTASQQQQRQSTVNHHTDDAGSGHSITSVDRSIAPADRTATPADRTVATVDRPAMPDNPVTSTVRDIASIDHDTASAGRTAESEPAHRTASPHTAASPLIPSPPHSPSSPPTAQPPRTTAPRDWIPDQPGAWAMAILPALAGMIVCGANATTAWLLAAWVLCYCVQFTTARWLKSRFARRYLPPVVVYTALLAAVGLPFVIVHPTILWWAPLYLVLAGLSFAAAWLRRERTLWGNAVAILASCAMAMVVGSFGTHAAGAQIPSLANGGLPAAIVFLLTQFGSVLFVKTMIRERGNAEYLWASWIWHGVVLAAACGLWGLLGFGRLFAMLALAGVWLMIRAITMPLIARRRTVKPIVVGLVEMVSSLLVFAAVVMTF